MEITVAFVAVLVSELMLTISVDVEGSEVFVLLEKFIGFEKKHSFYSWESFFQGQVQVVVLSVEKSRSDHKNLHTIDQK